MKIGLTGSSLNNKDNLSGSATPIIGLMNELVKYGHEVVWFERNPISEVRGFSPVPVYQATEGTVAELSEELKLDLVIIQTWNFAPAHTAKVFKEHGAKVYFWDDNTPFAIDRLLPTEPFVDKFLTHGNGAADFLRKSGIPDKKIEVFYFATDPQRFRPDPSPKLESDVTFVGTNMEERNTSLEQMFFKPSKIFKNKKFNLYGSGWDTWGQLAQFPVEYRGWVNNEDLHKIFSNAAISVNATRSVFSKVKCVPSNRIFDVLASGSILLSDPIPGIENLFSPGEELLIAKNTQEAVDQMRYIFNNPTEAFVIAKKGRAKVLQKHTWTHRIQQLGLDS